MEKVTDFLEKNVQWIVLSIALLFVGYMAYQHILQPPHVVEIGSKTLKPGEVNEAIVQGPVQRIKEDAAKPAPELIPNDFVSAFVQRMNFETPQYAQVFEPLPSGLFPGKGDVATPPEDRPDAPVVVDISNLPKPPVPTGVETAADRMVAKIADMDAKPARNRADAVVEKEFDVDWVTVGAKIDARALQTAFEKAFKVEDAPDELFQTRFLRVEMERQELMPDGSWGNSKMIAPLKIHKMKPFPGPDATEKEKLEYLDWVEENGGMIATPAFYEWAKGPQWYPPGTEKPELATPVGAPGGITGGYFDPANPPKRKLTREEKRLVDEHKRREREMRRMRPGPGGPFPPGISPRNSRTPRQYSPAPGSRRGGQGMTPEEHYRRMRQQQRGGYPNPYGRPGVFPGIPGMPQPGRFPVPNPGAGMGTEGTFDVSTLEEDLQIWAHDEEPTPGKTYRYRLRYSLLNPLRQVRNVAKDKKLEEDLSLTSDWSAWSEPVKISDRINFWLANATVRDAKFEVYEWKDGAWKSRTEEAAPGDPIGKTDWVVVDLRRNSRGGGVHVLLANKEGDIVRRDPRRDEDDPERIKLQEQVEMTAAASAGAR